MKLPWQEIEWVVDEIEANNEVIQVKIATLRKAIFLADRYQLQWFDSIIVASALETNCSILYSEDLHNGLKIETLEIVNPFR